MHMVPFSSAFCLENPEFRVVYAETFSPEMVDTFFLVKSWNTHADFGIVNPILIFSVKPGLIAFLHLNFRSLKNLIFPVELAYGEPHSIQIRANHMLHEV